VLQPIQPKSIEINHPFGCLVICALNKTRSGDKHPCRGVSPSAFCSMEKHTMKTLIITALLIVGGIQVGFSAFDAGVASVQKTETAQNIKARQAF
jgi:hypothetical protein